MSRPEEDRSARPDREAIIEAVAADPDASAAELAEKVPNATPELVERVLGRPDEWTDADAPATVRIGEYPDREDISDRQIRTLQAIAAHPDATQRDIASFLVVTAATVSNRVNSLPGFDWDDRRTFVKEVLDLEAIPGSDRTASSSDNELYETVKDLRKRVERLEQYHSTMDAERKKRVETPFDDPELARKVIHLCLDADEITDEEERRILSYVLDRPVDRE